MELFDYFLVGCGLVAVALVGLLAWGVYRLMGL